VRQQPAARFGAWPIQPRPEDDVGTDGVGPGIERAGGCRGAGVSVDAHATEVVTEPWLEEVARGWFERSAGPAYDVLRVCGRLRRVEFRGVVCSCPSQFLGVITFLFLACPGLARRALLGFTFLASLTLALQGSRAASADGCRIRHPYDPIRGAVRRMLERIVNPADHQLRLHDGRYRRCAKLSPGPGSVRAVKRECGNRAEVR